MSWTLDLDASRERLLAERARTREAIANDRIVAPGPMTYGSQAAAASQVFEQQRDLALREKEEQHLEAVEAALARLDAGLYGQCTSCGQAHPARATGCAPVGRPVHRMPAPGRPAPMTTKPVETAADLVGIEAIRAAARTLRGIALHTPLLAFGPPERRHYLKAESLQPIGAFKIRGAYVAVASLDDAERARGVITYSSGNHAQGVARAARLLGAPAVVVMPSDAPAIKRDRVAADGAEIVVVGTASEERKAVAERIALERGLSIIPPYDDDRIIAGQGTIGLELIEDLPDLAAVLVPIGGGGLASGIATAIKALRPEARVIGVESELAADAQASLRAGHIVRWAAEDVGRTIADGTRTQAIGVRPFAHFQAFLDDIVTVAEAEIAAAVRIVAEETRLVVEPSGALSVAALRSRAREAGVAGVDGPVVAIVSGGNVDPERYRGFLEAPIP